MVRVSEDGPKRKCKTGIQSKGNCSDDSDEDYVASEEGNEVSACSEDFCSSLDEDSEASFEEEKEERRNPMKVGKSKRKKCSRRLDGDEDDEYELEDDEDYEDEERSEEERRNPKKVGQSKRKKHSGRFDGDEDEYELEDDEDYEDDVGDEERNEEERRNVRRNPKKVGKSKRKKHSGRFDGDEDEYELEDDEEYEDDVGDEERNEEERRSVRRNPKKVGKSKRKKRSGGFGGDEDEYELEDDEEYENDVGDEERNEVKTTGRSKVQGRFSRLRKNGVLNPKKKIAEDDEIESEEEDEIKVTCTSKLQGGSSGLRKNGVIHSKMKRRSRCQSEEENDDDDEEFTPSNDEQDEDEDFTADEDDSLDEEELSIVNRKKSKKNSGKQVRRKKGSVKRRKMRSKTASKKPLTKKARTTRPFKRKVRSEDDDADFIDNQLVLAEKSEVHKRRRLHVDSDSDFAPSPESEYKFTVSEEEREQMREAKEFCRKKPDLRSSLTCDKTEDNAVLQSQVKPKAKKGKEKIEDEIKAEIVKKVCGICLSEEDKRRVRGRLNCCTHYFCFICISEWAKVESRCPLCKQRFNTISKLARSKAVVDSKEVTIQVPERDQVYQPTEEELRSFLYPYEDVICLECHQGGHDDVMLLCDECDSSAHTFCIGLGYEVPEGSWFCRECKPQTPESPIVDVDNVGEAFDLNSVSQGTDSLQSPRLYLGGYQPSLSFSGAGASTVSSRMRLQQHVHQRLSGGNFLNSQSDNRESVIQRGNTLFSEERFHEDSVPEMQNSELIPGSTVSGYQQQPRQSNDGSNNAREREGGDFQKARDQLQLMVKTHLKNLSRTVEIAHGKLEEISKGSTQAILAACELVEQRSNNPASSPPTCDHSESAPGSTVSLWCGCCSSCFDSFVGDVVKKTLERKLSEERQWLNLNLAL